MNTSFILFHQADLRKSVTTHTKPRFNTYTFSRSRTLKSRIDRALVRHRRETGDLPGAIVVHFYLYYRAKAHLASRPETAGITVLITGRIAKNAVWTEIKEPTNA